MERARLTPGDLRRSKVRSGMVPSATPDALTRYVLPRLTRYGTRGDRNVVAGAGCAFVLAGQSVTQRVPTPSTWTSASPCRRMAASTPTPSAPGPHREAVPSVGGCRRHRGLARSRLSAIAGPSEHRGRDGKRHRLRPTGALPTGRQEARKGVPRSGERTGAGVGWRWDAARRCGTEPLPVCPTNPSPASPAAVRHARHRGVVAAPTDHHAAQPGSPGTRRAVLDDPDRIKLGHPPMRWDRNRSG